MQTAVPETPVEAPQLLRVGAPTQVLLLAEPALLHALNELCTNIAGVTVAGAFSSVNELADWLVWKRADWQVAFVDFALRNGRPTEAIGSLFAQEQPGQVVALGPVQLPEMHEACAAVGIRHLVNRGDLAAARRFLEDWLLQGDAVPGSVRATAAA